MNLHELLKHQSKEVLLKLAEISDASYDKDTYNKFNTKTLASRILKTDRTIDEINDMLKTFGGIPLEELEEMEELAGRVIENIQNDETESKDIGTSLTEVKKLQSKSHNNEQLNLRRLIKDAKEKAFQTVIVTVTPADPRDIETKKECEAFSIENQYFKVSRVVPFNIPCEVEKCIAQLIKDTKYVKNIVNTPSQVKETLMYSRQVMVPKYNITINDVNTFIDSKRRGLR